MPRVLVVDPSEGNALRVLAAVVRENLPYQHLVDADSALELLRDSQRDSSGDVVVVGLLPPGEKRRLLSTMEREHPELVESTIVINHASELESAAEVHGRITIRMPFAVDDLEEAIVRCASGSDRG